MPRSEMHTSITTSVLKEFFFEKVITVNMRGNLLCAASCFIVDNVTMDLCC